MAKRDHFETSKTKMCEAVLIGEHGSVEAATGRILAGWVSAGKRQVDFPNMKGLAKPWMGRPAAILATRYWYRGVLKDVTERAMVLDTPSVVTMTGMSRRTKPKEEYHVVGPILVPITSVELVAQPKWCYADMPLFDREHYEKYPVLPRHLCKQVDDGWDMFDKYKVTPKRGMRLAVLGHRYCYRGVAGDIFPDCMVLEKAIAVETSGKPEDEQTACEDWIGSDVLIPASTIQKIFQCRWCHDSLRAKKYDDIEPDPDVDPNTDEDEDEGEDVEE